MTIIAQQREDLHGRAAAPELCCHGNVGRQPRGHLAEAGRGFGDHVVTEPVWADPGQGDKRPWGRDDEDDRQSSAVLARQLGRSVECLERLIGVVDRESDFAMVVDHVL